MIGPPQDCDAHGGVLEEPVEVLSLGLLERPHLTRDARRGQRGRDAHE